MRRDAARLRVALMVALFCALLPFVVGYGPARGQEATDALPGEITCPDASVFSADIVTEICWDCVFPIYVAGVPIGARGSSGDRRSGELPAGVLGPSGAWESAKGRPPVRAVSQPVCFCTDDLGVPKIGITISMWQPARLIEVVRAPGCSPVLGGLRIPTVHRLRRGMHAKPTYDAGDRGFYYFHLWSFPILELLNLFSQDRCNQDGFVDIDAMYLSELDPTLAFDELSVFTTPEVVLFANPLAVASCVADAVASNAGEPLDAMFWCAGSWGTVYPLSGNYLAPASQPRDLSLLATKGLAAMHRRGLAWRTMGEDTLCSGVIDPFLSKSMYRMSVWHPWPEADDNHVIGESTFFWGEWRNQPATGEDHVYLVWRWVDCCSAGR